MKSLLFFLLALGAFAKPNIILILADDLGTNDVSPTLTPQIDAIAQAGVRCAQAYATAPVCAPSRAGLLTGRYQQSFGFEDNPGPFRRSPDIEVGLDLGQKTIADRLKALGYATGMVGKWHDGKSAAYQPPARGFDEFYGFNNGAQRYLDVDSSQTPMMRGTQPEKHGKGYLTTSFGREAAAFVDRHKDEPFFLYLSFNAPHGPLTATPEYLAKFAGVKNNKRRRYLAMVAAMDDAVGELRAKLAEHELTGDTLLVFTSDHGAVKGQGDNGALRAGKGTLYEGGLRVPLYFAWPKGLPAGGRVEEPVTLLDLLPTFVAAAGGDVKVDGANLLPKLRSESSSRPHARLHWRQNEMWAIRDGDWKLVKDRGMGGPQLFNLATDPSEKANLAKSDPERVSELRSSHEAWEKSVERPRFGWWKGVGKRYGRPNILFIFSDDHALRTIGAYGGINKTPNIDRIAEQGAIFNRSYCTNSICCPSRASIITGKHSHKNGVTGNGSHWNGNQFVFSRKLSAGGYKTGLIGKWHIHGEPGDAFDYWRILSGASGQGHYYNPEFRDMDGSTKQLEGYSTDLITDQAIVWMRTQKNADAPFMLMCNFKAPHIHRIPPPRHMDKYDGQTLPMPETFFDDFKGRTSYADKCWMKLAGMQEPILNIVPPAGQYDLNRREFEFLKRMTPAQRAAFHESYDPDNAAYRGNTPTGDDLSRYQYQRFIKDYLACVAAIDDNVGRMLGWLKGAGIDDNTVVVYGSDQGFFTGEHGWNDKRWMYEETLSMPLLMRWQGRIKPGTRIDAMVQNIDYAPTFLDMAGMRIPQEVDGRSLLPLFKGAKPDDWRDSVYYHYYDDGSYNLPRFEGVRGERFKLISYYYPKQEWELFDLEKDPGEMTSQHANPEYAEVRARLEAKLGELRKQYDVPPLNLKKRR
ncbi:MAG: arylsulfatase A-like enzyme [Rhodothermales bacterium]|jgi:arylsulfatase A-like enzyme